VLLPVRGCWLAFGVLVQDRLVTRSKSDAVRWGAMIRPSGSSSPVSSNPTTLLSMTITDVDDVLGATVEHAGTPSDKFAPIQQFHSGRDMAALGVRAPLRSRFRRPPMRWRSYAFRAC
jgi:hypothetical protein